jgi:hypothetical protein
MATRPRTPNADDPEAVTPRLTSRQKRIAEQHLKIEAMRRQQRQKQLIWGGVILIMVLVVVGLVFFLRPGGGTTITADERSQGRFIQGTGEANHVPAGTVVQYNSRPPTSGNHYDTPSGYGVFDRAVPTGNWVHNLEHGAIVVLYRPDLCDATCTAAVKDVYKQAPRSKQFNNVKLVVTPYPDMDHAVAAVAWQWVDEMDTGDEGRILAFYRDHVDKGPEQVP